MAHTRLDDMRASDLSSWPILECVMPDLLAQIHMLMIYGEKNSNALIVTRDKTVYSLGFINVCLGIESTSPAIFPQKLEALCDKDLKTFAYGNGPHVLALTKQGEVYAWGFNYYGELGIGSYDNALTPTLVNMPTQEDNLSTKHIIDIACGQHHSVVLTKDGEVYAWGQNSCGQVGSISTKLSTPKLVNSILAGKRVLGISCGCASTMVVTENGKVYGWGNNQMGQLGIGNYKNKTTPQLVTSLKGIVIVKVTCGFAHTLALTDEGKLCAWGRNDYGQLGIDNITNSCNPVMVQHQMGRVSDIATLHYNHISAAVGKGGRVYVWGLCRGYIVKTPKVTALSSIHDVFASYGSPSVMHKPLILSEKGSSILENIRTAFDNSLTSDLKILVEGQYIHVHKAILKIRSSYFKTMFNWTENNQSVIEPDQFSYIVYKAFLKYLYTDMIDLPMEKVLDLFRLASAYCESNLKKNCVDMIKQGITISNVAYFYSIAIEYSEEELEEFCFSFALNNMTAVTQTENFAKLNENATKTFIIKASKTGAFKT